MAEVIRAEGVSMRFRMDLNRTSSLKEWFVSAVQGKRRFASFQALTDVSLSVEAGEVVGVIGRNGSGKSTLLKVISGIYRPTAGQVTVRGRVAPMLELGSGFDMELTGRENIFLNGAILGFEEEWLRSRYDEIVAFSELGDFIGMPVKTYSSGMLMRLAFSVAAMAQPEVLIVDEILAVGDAAFQQKSRERMRQMMSGGAAVLFVSHSAEQVCELCTRAIWLDGGRVRMDGPAREVCGAYEAFLDAQQRQNASS